MAQKKIFFMGTGTVGRECLKILKNTVKGTQIECFAVENEVIPTMAPLCSKLEIPYRQVPIGDVGRLLLGNNGEILIISAHNEYIFPKEVVDSPNIKIINFHNAYLPNYRGRNAPTWEIYEGRAYGGATWHEVDASIDTGGIIVQEKVPVEEDETALSLLMKCARTGIRLMRENVGVFLSGDYVTRPTGTKGRLYLSKELPNGGFLDTSWDMEQAYRFLRSMDYRPMDILPLPRVRLKDTVYEIEGYGIREGKVNDLERNALRIMSNDGSFRLVCSLREKKK